MTQYTSDAPTQTYAPMGLPSPTSTGDFGWALMHLRDGRGVARSGWNGKSMFLFLVPGSTFAVAEGRPMAAHFAVGTTVDYQPHIDMFTAQGTVVPWLASQSDILATDWCVLPSGNLK